MRSARTYAVLTLVTGLAGCSAPGASADAAPPPCTEYIGAEPVAVGTESALVHVVTHLDEAGRLWTLYKGVLEWHGAVLQRVSADSTTLFSSPGRLVTLPCEGNFLDSYWSTPLEDDLLFICEFGTSGLLAQRFSAGATGWDARELRSISSSDRSIKGVRPDDAGGFHVIWRDGDTYLLDRFDGSGVSTWTVPVVMLQGADHVDPPIWLRPDGVALYYDAPTPQVQVWEPDGTTRFTEPLAIPLLASQARLSPNDGTGGWWLLSGRNVGSSDVCGDTAWRYEVLLQSLDGSGAAQWPGDGIAVQTDATSTVVLAAASDDGAIVLAWSEEDPESPGTCARGVTAHRIAADGNVEWSVRLDGWAQDHYVQAGDLALSDSGSLTGTFVGDGGELLATSLARDGTARFARAIVDPACASVERRDIDAVVPDPSDGAFIIWRDEGGPRTMWNGEVPLAQRLTPSGTRGWE